MDEVKEIKGAIEHINDVLQSNCNEQCKDDHRQLKKWLEELLQIKQTTGFHSETIVFLNMTAGMLSYRPDSHFHFCRLQSSHLERHAIIPFINSIPDEMLLFLALGKPVVITDATTNTKSKVLTVGIEIIKYLCKRYWFGVKEISPLYKNWQFMIENSLTKEIKKRFLYFKKFLLIKSKNDIKLEGQVLFLEKEDSEGIVDAFLETYKRSGSSYKTDDKHSNEWDDYVKMMQTVTLNVYRHIRGGQV